jgi:hypothetical protein
VKGLQLLVRKILPDQALATDHHVLVRIDLDPTNHSGLNCIRAAFRYRPSDRF